MNHSSRFIVQTSTAKMPTSCWGRYRNVAVIETDGRASVAMISERARGVRSIVSFDGPLHDGGSRSAAAKAVARANELATRLNWSTVTFA